MIIDTGTTLVLVRPSSSTSPFPFLEPPLSSFSSHTTLTTFSLSLSQGPPASVAKFFKKVRGAKPFQNGYWSYPCAVAFKAALEFGGVRYEIPSKCTSLTLSASVVHHLGEQLGSPRPRTDPRRPQPRPHRARRASSSSLSLVLSASTD